MYSSMMYNVDDDNFGLVLLQEKQSPKLFCISEVDMQYCKLN